MILSRFCLLTLVVCAPLRLSAADPAVAVIADAVTFREGITGSLRAAGVKVVPEASLSPAALEGCTALIWQRSDFTPLPAAQQKALTDFVASGGGIVAVNAAVAAGDVGWVKPLLGGAWTAESRKFPSRMMLYIRPDGGPVGRDASSFDLDDDTLYDLDVADDVFVIASAFTPKVGNTRDGKKSQRALEEEAKSGGKRASIYDIQAQVWTWQGEKHRAAIFLQGAPESLEHTAMRALMLRAAAWTARVENVDAWLPKDAADTLRYPMGGPLRPAEAVQQFQLQPGFKAEVIAAEPLIAKPIAVQWDARGRLWVAETPEYPNGRRQPKIPWKDTGTLEPGNESREARDSISVLEDTNGDGIMDRKSVFCTGIELVCGFCFYKDGLIVLDYPHISWIRDTDGDGKSDKKEIIFGGLPFPNHFILNHLIVSPDGWIYGSSGCGYKPTRPGSEAPVTTISPGIFRFRPDGSAIEQVGSRGGNSFGIDLTSDLELYQSQATSSNPVQHLVLPEWVLAKAGKTEATSLSSVNPKRPVFRKDLPDRAPFMQIGGVGYYSAACASLVYEGGAWPAEYDGTVWCTEPILDIIHHERLKPNGPTFTGELLLPDSEWLRSPDYWFCPVDVAVGPDGAMFVLDFYTPVVAHNDTRGPQHGPAGASVRPDREHYFGRIYRIQHEQARRFDIPDLTKASPAELVSAFSHPNRTVRFNAHQSLMERADAATSETALRKAMQEAAPSAQVLALWALQRLGKLSAADFTVALSSPHAAVRKNALLVAEEAKKPLSPAQVGKALDDSDPRVRLAALRALTAAGVDSSTGALLLAAKFTDPWSQAAAAAALSTNPGAQLSALFRSGGSIEAARGLAENIVARGDTAAVVALLGLAAKSPEAGATALSVIGARPPAAPQPAPVEALRALLVHQDRNLAAASFALAAAWDGGALEVERSKLVRELAAAMNDGPVPQRVSALRALVAARASDSGILPAVTALLRKPQPPELFAPLVAALASTGEEPVGRALVMALPKVNAVSRGLVFDAVLSRAAWTAMLLDLLDQKSFSPGLLTPTQLSSLRSHPDAPTATRAKALLEKLGSGSSPAKDAIIAQLLPAVQQRGNAVNGKALFATCAACHRLGGEGFDLGPPLDGMGAHPAADLLVHIVDPNRSVDEEHQTWNFTMKEGTQYAALIATENDATVKIRLPGGITQDLPAADIAARKKVASSLMPEGLESLGGEALRDIIAYMQSFSATAGTASVPAASGAFRPLDLSGAFTADNRQGLFNSQSNRDNTFDFLKLGRVTANGVPFDIADPAATANERSLIVLRADRPGTHAATYPARVEIPVGFAARRFHFLGGSAGWGGGKGGNTPAMKLTLHYAGGAVQEIMLRSGHEFADYIRRIDVPGSQFAEGIARTKNVRTFSIQPDRSEAVQKLVLESPNNRIAATTIAITAEVGEGVPASDPPSPVKPPAAEPKPAPAPPPAPKPVPGPDDPRTTLPTGQKFAEPKAAGTLRVLLAGAGSSHDFPRFFLKQDAETLKAAGGFDIAATPNLEEALTLLPQADVLVFSGNHGQYGSPRFQQALKAFADAGKGIVILHAGVWRNFPEATGFNKRFVGGGTRSHGSGEFTVTVREPSHPVMQGVPATFTIRDESYHIELDAAQTDVLAENAPDARTQRPHPSVWTVRDAKARILCLSLGHAEPAHSNPAYKALLTNAVRWVAGQP